MHALCKTLLIKKIFSSRFHKMFCFVYSWMTTNNTTFFFFFCVELWINTWNWLKSKYSDSKSGTNRTKRVETINKDNTEFQVKCNTWMSDGNRINSDLNEVYSEAALNFHENKKWSSRSSSVSCVHIQLGVGTNKIAFCQVRLYYKQ